jgi:hypothetical protein
MKRRNYILWKEDMKKEARGKNSKEILREVKKDTRLMEKVRNEN